ncbi:MAG: outer membrane beta-barrel protein [Elusimicrobia bacterium]|nr:outer membrane beta-barrel protein [Elusimicrobiota bacterium]
MSSRLIIAAALMLAALPAKAEWQPNLKLGSMELHPFYEGKASYDDNIYRVSPDKQDGTRSGCTVVVGATNANTCSGGKRGSWFMTDDLGIKVMLPIGEMHKISAGYDAKFTHYDRQAAANKAIHQAADFEYLFKGSVLSARAWDNYVKTQDPPFNPNSTGRATGNITTGGELVNREHRWSNAAGLYLEYALGDKFFFGADASDARQKYRSPALAAILDNSVQTYGFKTGYKILPKTRIFGALHRSMTHYSAGRKGVNHKDWLADFGAEGEFTAKLKGRVQTGFSFRHYDVDGTAVPSTVTTNWTAAVGLNYKPFSRTTIDLSATRGLSEATGVRFSITNTVALSAAQEIGKLTAKVNGSVTIDKYSDSQTTPSTNNPATLLPSGMTASRRDDSYAAGLGFNYKFTKWLSASADYTHMRRHSIFTWEYNYKANVTSFGLKAAF